MVDGPCAEGEVDEEGLVGVEAGGDGVVGYPGRGADTGRVEQAAGGHLVGRELPALGGVGEGAGVEGVSEQAVGGDVHRPEDRHGGGERQRRYPRDGVVATDGHHHAVFQVGHQHVAGQRVEGGADRVEGFQAAGEGHDGFGGGGVEEGEAVDEEGGALDIGTGEALDEG